MSSTRSNILIDRKVECRTMLYTIHFIVIIKLGQIIVVCQYSYGINIYLHIKLKGHEPIMQIAT